MKFDWDEPKRVQNLREHALDFNDVAKIWDNPFVEDEDRRKDYGERRIVRLTTLRSRIVVVVYTRRDDDRIRLISFRKANHREARRFAAEVQQRP